MVAILPPEEWQEACSNRDISQAMVIAAYCVVVIKSAAAAAVHQK